MKSLKVHNIRSLVDVEKIDIAPLTVFVGKNSSGKSSMLRCFPLLKQTFEVRTSEPILWYSNYVDFGSFEESLFSEAKSKSINFEFELNTTAGEIYYRTRRNIHFYNYNRINRLYDADDILYLKVAVEVQKTKIIRALMIFEDQKIEIEYDEKEKISKLLINDTDYLIENTKYHSLSQFIPEIYIEDDRKNVEEVFRDNYRRYNTHEREYRTKLYDMIKKEVHNNTSRETIFSIVDRLSVISSKSKILNALSRINDPKTIIPYINAIKNDYTKQREINDIIVAINLNSIIAIFNNQLKKDSSNIFYAKPLRADVQRYYRIQGLNINEIEPSGENIPMFLNNLTKAERNNFIDFTNKLFGFNYDIKPTTGHVSVHITTEKSEKSVNISDVGVGYSQVLPIIANLWLMTQSKSNSYTEGALFVIEQPELHLHPAFQAKLVDAFAKIAKDNNIKILFETHSETMIGRLGTLITNEELDEKDVNVYIFDKDNELTTKIIKTNFNERGKLQNWPVGFFSPDVK